MVVVFLLLWCCAAEWNSGNSLIIYPQEEEEPVTQVATPRGPLPSSETVEEAQAVLISPTRHIDFELQACSPAENQQVRP